MIIYNVTILIDSKREKEFVDWMQNEHIQEVIDTKLFQKAIFSKVNTDNKDGETFSTQYYCENKNDLEKYTIEFAPKLQEKGLAIFGNDMLGFRTELHILKVFEN